MGVALPDSVWNGLALTLSQHTYITSLAYTMVVVVIVTQALAPARQELGVGVYAT